LKPYWGKPAVRNFRGGGENTGVFNGHAVRPLSTRWFQFLKYSNHMAGQTKCDAPLPRQHTPTPRTTFFVYFEFFVVPTLQEFRS
jgi:hypothetical protein